MKLRHESFKDLTGQYYHIKKHNDKILIMNDTDKPIQLDLPEELRHSPRESFQGELIRHKKDVYMQIMRVVQIHGHTEYSLFDGASKVEKIAEALEYAGAITDHGVMFGAISFYKSMKKLVKKPMIGFEAYCESIDGIKEGQHLLLLIKNQQGYKNAIKLISMAEENVYKKPHISYDMLEEHSEGLIATSACMGGELSQLLLTDQYDKALEVIEVMQDIFGDDYYIEIQRHKMDDEKIVNPLLIQISEETGTKLVASNDYHYANKDDEYSQEVLLTIGTKGKMYEEHFKFDGTGYYIPNAEEFERQWEDLPQIFDNLDEIVRKISFDFDFDQLHMPNFPIPPQFSDESKYFEHLVKEGFKDRFEGTDAFTSQEYKDRLQYEIDTINSMGFPGYFLITWDFIKFAKEQGIYVGPGRGSAVGSLVSFCLKITNLDPIPYGLLFERFLNPERITMPDIDIDFQDDRREEVIDYVKDKYGAEAVSRIITFGTMAARAAVRDIGRVMGTSQNKIDTIAKSIPAVPGMTIAKAMKESPEFRDMYEDDDETKEIVDIAMKLEGIARHKSQHACGLIIANNPISNFVPEVLLDDKHNKGKKVRTAAFNMKELEMLGLLKMDFLGLRNLGIIKETVDTVNADYGTTYTFDNIPLDDPYVYKFIGSGKTGGLFQIESAGMQSLMKQMFGDVASKIHKIEQDYKLRGFKDIVTLTKFNETVDLDELKDEYLVAMKKFGKELFERLIAAISLYRPGPMDYIPDYIDGMNDPSSIHYDCPELEEILATTYGVIVYQEQVQQIVRKLAGYSLGRGDLIRRAMGKKDMTIMAKEKNVFLYGNAETYEDDGEALVEGCVARGIPEEIALIIWEKMETFALYAFNKSHSAGYAVISIVTGYLKTYYPVEFMTATLNSVINNAKKLKFYLAQTKKLGIEILLPSINKSATKFKKEGDKIRVGLMSLRNLGKMSRPIVEERSKGGFFKNLEEFIDRMINNMDKRMLESLIYSGASDEFVGTRQAKINTVPEILDFIQYMKKGNVDSHFNLPELDVVYREMNPINFDDSEEFEKLEKLEKEYEYAGMYISEHPIDDYKTLLGELGVLDIEAVLPEEADDDDSDGVTPVSMYDDEYVTIAGVVKEIKQLTTRKSGERMLVCVVEDDGADIKIVVFPRQMADNEDKILEGNLVTVNGKVQSDDFGTQIIATTVSHARDTIDIEPARVYVKAMEQSDLDTIQDMVADSKGNTELVVVLGKQKMKLNHDINFSLETFLELKDKFQIKVNY